MNNPILHDALFWQGKYYEPPPAGRTLKNGSTTAMIASARHSQGNLPLSLTIMEEVGDSLLVLRHGGRRLHLPIMSAYEISYETYYDKHESIPEPVVSFYQGIVGIGNRKLYLLSNRNGLARYEAASNTDIYDLEGCLYITVECATAFNIILRITYLGDEFVSNTAKSQTLTIMNSSEEEIVATIDTVDLSGEGTKVVSELLKRATNYVKKVLDRTAIPLLNSGGAIVSNPLFEENYDNLFLFSWRSQLWLNTSGILPAIRGDYDEYIYMQVEMLGSPCYYVFKYDIAAAIPANANCKYYTYIVSAVTILSGKIINLVTENEAGRVVSHCRNKHTATLSDNNLKGSITIPTLDIYATLMVTGPYCEDSTILASDLNSQLVKLNSFTLAIIPGMVWGRESS